MKAQECGARRANGEPHEAQGHRNQERASRAYLTSTLAAPSESLITPIRQEAAKGCHQNHGLPGQKHCYQHPFVAGSVRPDLRHRANLGFSGVKGAAEQHPCKSASESKAANPWCSLHIGDGLAATKARCLSGAATVAKPRQHGSTRMASHSQPLQDVWRHSTPR